MSKEPKSINEPHAAPQSTVAPAELHSINEPPGSEIAAPSFTVTSIDPTGAEIGSDDLTLSVFGTNFAEGAQIVFNNGAENTVFVSDTELTTIVKPSTASVAGSYPVTVAQAGSAFDPPQMFTFSEAEPVSRSRRHR